MSEKQSTLKKRTDLLPLFYPYVPQEAIDEVNDTLHTRWIGEGPKVPIFEKMFEEKFGLSHAVAQNSGSSALETALDLLDLKPGDEVIAPVLTCTATNLPLVRRGLKIVFPDINAHDLNMSREEVFMRITPKTKLIMNVHNGGIVNDLSSFQHSHGIPVIDDSCQALGAKTDARFTCYSFQAIKHITTGDGGMLICGTEEEKAKAKLLRWFGIDRDKRRESGWLPWKDREMTTDIEIPGYKRQMTDIAASMGIGGLKTYDRTFAEREAIFSVYKTIKKPGFRLVNGPNNKYWLAQVVVERRDDFSKKLLDWNVETNMVQLRNDIYKVFGGQRRNLPIMKWIEDRYVSIPLHNRMTVEDAEYVKAVIESGW